MKRLLFMMWEAGAALYKWRGDVEGAAGVSACVLCQVAGYAAVAAAAE